MAGGGIGEMMLLNAAIGGTVSAVSGGDPLKGMLLGGLSGGIMGAAGGAAAGATSAGTNAAAQTGANLAANAATAAGTDAAAQGLASLGGQSFSQASQLAMAGLDPAQVAAQSALSNAGAVDGAASVLNAAAPAGFTPPTIDPTMLKGAPTAGASGFVPPADQGILGGLKDAWSGLSPEKKLLYGGMGGLGALSLMQSMGQKVPGAEKYDGPLSKFVYDPKRYRRSQFADGGIVALTQGGVSDLGTYSDGGRMLKGPGDGMSDNIPGVIGGKRPARLADGEFVVPADVVSHLGNGSTDAGAKQLYAMMDRVRRARTGTKKQGRQIRPGRMMPA